MAEQTKGLTVSEVKKSKNQNGNNQIEIPLGPSFIKRFIKGFFSSSQLLLLCAIAISWMLFNYKDYSIYYTYVLLAVYVIRAILDLYYLKQGSIDYEDLLKNPTKVLRDGKAETVESNDLAVGDLILVTQNDMILVDGTILQADQLVLNEEIFNYRNKHITKKAGDPVYLGSKVLFGSAMVKVTNVGKNTILGKSTSIQSESISTAKKFERTIHLASLAVLLIGAGIGLYGLYPAMDMSMGNLADAFESVFVLYALASLNPSLLLSDRTIYRNLKKLNKADIEIIQNADILSLSEIDLLILDQKESFTKEDKAVVQSFADDQDLIGLGLGLYAKDHNDDYTLAFANFAKDKKFDIDALRMNMPIVKGSDHPDFKHIVSNIYTSDKGYILYSIGSVDDLLDASKFIYSEGKDIFFGAKERELIGRQCAAMKDLGQEVVGIAYQVRKEDIADINNVKDLTFIGLVGLMHPLKDDVKEQVERLKNAGVEVMMLSDERPDLAGITAKDAHIIDDFSQVLVASNLETMTERRLLANFSMYKVFVGLNGAQKQRIIEAASKNYKNIAVSICSLEELRNISTSSIKLTSHQETSEFVSSLGNICLKDHTLTTITVAMEEAAKAMQRYYKVIQFSLSYFMGLSLFMVLAIAINLFGKQSISLVDPYILTALNAVIFILGNMIGHYDSKVINQKGDGKILSVSMINMIMIAALALLTYLLTWYYGHAIAYFEISLFVLIIAGTYLFENHKKNSYAFHFVFTLIRLLILALVGVYYFYYLALQYSDPMYSIYIALPLLVIVIGCIVKKLGYGRG